MRKSVAIMILALALLIAGCTGVSQCVNDGVCTVDEKFLGGCQDCLPDFEITQSDITIDLVSFDEAEEWPSNVDQDYLMAVATVRVVNKGGDHNGDLRVTRGSTVETDGIGAGGAAAVPMTLDFTGAEASVDIDVEKGQIIPVFELDRENPEQIFSFNAATFDPSKETEITVSVSINTGDKDSELYVEEQNQSNNAASASIIFTPEPQERDAIITEDIGENVLLSSSSANYPLARNPYSYHYVNYGTTTYSNSGRPSSTGGAYLRIYAYENEGNANNMYSRVRLPQENIEGHGVKAQTSNANQFTRIYWVSGNTFVSMFARTASLGVNDKLVKAYIDLYPSNIQVEPAEELIISENIGDAIFDSSSLNTVGEFQAGEYIEQRAQYTTNEKTIDAFVYAANPRTLIDDLWLLLLGQIAGSSTQDVEVISINGQNVIKADAVFESDNYHRVTYMWLADSNVVIVETEIEGINGLQDAVEGYLEKYPSAFENTQQAQDSIDALE